MARGQRFDQTTAIAPVQLNSGADTGFMQLGAQMQQFSRQLAANKRAEVIDEQTRAGQEAFVAGEEPQFQEEGFIGGVASKAFNKGLKQSYLASLSNDMRTDLGEAELNYKDDVAGYTEQVAALRAAYAKEVDPAARLEALQSLDQQTALGLNRVRRGQAQKLRRESDINTQLAVDESAEAAYTMARQGESANAALELTNTAAALQGRVEAEHITQEQADEDYRFKSSYTHQQFLRGDLERIAEQQGVDAAIDAFKEGITTEPQQRATQKEWDTFRASVLTDLNRMKSRENAGRNNAKSKLAGEVKDYGTAKSMGMEVSAGEEQRLANAVVEYPELDKQFKNINKTAAFAVSSAADREAQLAEQMSTGQIKDVDLAVMLDSTNKKVNKAYQEDGYTMAVQQGIIQPTPLNLADPNTLQVRIGQTEVISQHSGFPTSPLTGNEAQSIADSLPTMTIEEQITLANTFQQAPAVWGQLAGKGAPLFAMVGAIGDEGVMQNVLLGKRELENKTVKSPTPKDYLADFNDIIGEVYGAGDKEAILSATLAHYAATGTDKTGEYNSGEFEESLKAITGGIGRVNDVKVELPRGVDEDALQDYFKDFDAQAVADAGGVQNMTNERAVEVISKSVPVSLGNGRYMMQREGATLFNDAGKPFVIQYSEQEAANVSARADAGKRDLRRKLRTGD